MLPSATSTDENSATLGNESFEMLVKLAGIVSFSYPEPKNALAPTVCTPSGMTTSPSFWVDCTSTLLSSLPHSTPSWYSPDLSSNVTVLISTPKAPGSIVVKLLGRERTRSSG